MSFDPSQLANLTLWLKADAGTYSDLGVTPATDGGTVEQWNDQSGLGNHATQTTAAQRFKWHSSLAVLGGMPGLECGYDTNGQAFRVSANVLNSGTFTLYGVAYLTGIPTAYSSLFGWNLDSDANDAGGLYIKNGPGAQSNTSAFYILKPGSTTTYDDWDGTGLQSWISAPHLFCLEVIGGTSATLHLNANVADSTCTLTAGTPNVIGHLMIGNSKTGYPTGRYGACYFGEIACYAAAHDAATRNQMWVYLRSRWWKYFLPTWYDTTNGYLCFLGSADGKNWSGVPYSPAGNYTAAGGPYGDYSLWIDTSTNPQTYRILASKTRTFPSNTTAIEYFESTDLATWTHHSIDVSSTGYYDNGAPDWFIDPIDNIPRAIFVGLDSGATTFDFFVIRPTTLGNYSAWNAPQLVTWSAKPTHCLDPFIVKIGSTYNLWLEDSDSGTEYCTYATATSLLGPYTLQHTSSNWTGWGSAEGPGLIQTVAGSPGTWRAYPDHYQTTSGLFWSDSTDGWATWTAPTALVGPFWNGSPTTYRHGTVTTPVAYTPPASALFRRTMFRRAGSRGAAF